MEHRNEIIKMKLQAVYNTVELLDIRPTYYNVNYLVGILRTLKEVQDALDGADGETDGEGAGTPGEAKNGPETADPED